MEISGIEVECNFDIQHWISVGTVYGCAVQNTLSIASPDVRSISNVTGAHKYDKNLQDVRAVYIKSKVVKYFPKNLQVYFKDLEVIGIWFGRIKQISQGDLEPFRKLKNLDLHYNDIEVLETDLFKSNKELIAIFIDHNRITVVQPEVFENLVNLNYLALQGNVCIDEGESEGDRTAVLEIIKKVSQQCHPSYYKFDLSVA